MNVYAISAMLDKTLEAVNNKGNTVSRWHNH